jgi:acetyl-CoA synthetase
MEKQLTIYNQYNIGHLCTRLQRERGRGNKVAMRWIQPAKEIKEFTFADLDAQSGRFANVLQRLGFSKGDVFFTFLHKMRVQFIAILGALKMQLVTGALFPGTVVTHVAAAVGGLPWRSMVRP